jgi:hypothetical protein
VVVDLALVGVLLAGVLLGGKRCGAALEELLLPGKILVWFDLVLFADLRNGYSVE